MLKTIDIQANDKTNRGGTPLTWIQLIDPSHHELERIAKDYAIPFTMLTMHQSNKNSTTIERCGDLFAFVMNLPLQNTTSKEVPFEATKLSFIVINSVLITISKEDHPIFAKLHGQSLTMMNDAGMAGFVFNIFEKINESFGRALEYVDRAVDEVENRLQVSISNKQVFELLNNNKSYLGFIRAFKHNEAILNEVSIRKLFASDLSLEMKLTDIIIATQQLKKRSEIYNANLRNLMDAYSAAIENNLSLAVQYLTVFVTIAAIPSAIAGIYGMNTPLPFQDEPYALAALGGIALVITIITIAFFKIRRYI